MTSTRRPYSPTVMVLLLHNLSSDSFTQVFNASVLAGMVQNVETRAFSERQIGLILSTTVVWG